MKKKKVDKLFKNSLKKIFLRGFTTHRNFSHFVLIPHKPVHLNHQNCIPRPSRCLTQVNKSHYKTEACNTGRTEEGASQHAPGTAGVSWVQPSCLLVNKLQATNSLCRAGNASHSETEIPSPNSDQRAEQRNTEETYCLLQLPHV